MNRKIILLGLLFCAGLFACSKEDTPSAPPPIIGEGSNEYRTMRVSIEDYISFDGADGPLNEYVLYVKDPAHNSITRWTDTVRHQYMRYHFDSDNKLIKIVRYKTLYEGGPVERDSAVISRPAANQFVFDFGSKKDVAELISLPSGRKLVRIKFQGAYVEEKSYEIYFNAAQQPDSVIWYRDTGNPSIDTYYKNHYHYDQNGALLGNTGWLNYFVANNNYDSVRFSCSRSVVTSTNLYQFYSKLKGEDLWWTNYMRRPGHDFNDFYQTSDLILEYTDCQFLYGSLINQMMVYRDTRNLLTHAFQSLFTNHSLSITPGFDANQRLTVLEVMRDGGKHFTNRITYF